MMRYKYKLSFSVLLISSSLVQSASAIENEIGELTNTSSITSGETIPKGSALITNSLLSSNIKIGESSVEVVENGAISMGATIEKGGVQIVTRSGTAMNTKIKGGKQFVHEEKNLDLTEVEKKSGAYDATVIGSDGIAGQQNIFDGAWAWNTKVGQNGEQNLYAGQRQDGGKAMNTVVSENGRQHVLAQGEAFNTTLQNQATQVVYPSGFLDSLTINSSARSWLHVGAKDVVGEVKVNGGGKLYLFAGDMTNHITKKRLPIQGRPEETIFLVSERNIREKTEVKIENLGGEEGTVIFTSIPYDTRHISLHVEELSGNLHFLFNISAKGNGSDYLSIGEGAGNHGISVTDSGREITNPLSQKNGFMTEVPLITDRSSNGGANFTLEDRFGAKITAVDGGTFLYTLQKRERCAGSSGDATIWYLGIGTENAEHSNTQVLCGKHKQKALMSSFVSSTDTKARSYQGSFSKRKNSDPKKHTSKHPPKHRPPRNLREGQNTSSVSTLKRQTVKEAHSASYHYPVDDGHQATVSGDASLIVDQMILRPSDQQQSLPQARKEISTPRFFTT
ncbi:pertactin-like passenger domain-containing protein, partial [Bartonella acomydis]|uniref:pertactin-like passenger domain-containing protein n=1 Tax=Bartonella acomydis TaxID=686234 RepID=UPI0031EDB9B1